MEKEAALTDALRYGFDAITRRGIWVFVIVWILLQVITLYLMRDLMQLFSADPTGMNVTADMVLQAMYGFIPAMMLAFIVNSILSLFIDGYLVRVLAGIVPAPEFSQWGRMFLDGLKLIIISIIYMLPLVLPVAVVSYVYLVSAMRILYSQAGSVGISQSAEVWNLVASWGVTMLVLMPFLIILGILLLLFGLLGSVRFARTGSMAEAFRFRSILAHIRRLGWVSYIFSLVVLILVLIVISIVGMLVLTIPGLILGSLGGSGLAPLGLVINSIVGIIMNLFFLYLMVISARYLALLYESAPSDV